MIGTVLLTSHAIAGGFWVQVADGWIYLPDELLITVAAFLGLTAIACWNQSKASATSSSSSVTRMSLDLPEEVQTPESVEHYDDMTARTRALKRKLDADTELAESYIKAGRAKAELEDLDSETQRRTRARQ